MIGVRNRRAWFATQQATVLASQLARTLHPAVAATGSFAFATDQRQPAVQIGTTTALDIPLAQQRSHIAGHLCQAQVLAAQQQMRDTRMRRQLGHGLAVFAEVVTAARLEGIEPRQQVLGLGEGGRGRLVEPAQLLGRHTPARQLQGQAGQVGLHDLGAAVGGQLVMLGLGPQAVTHAGLQAAGTAGALSGTGARDALGVQTSHAAARVETRYPGQACVDHHAHAVDGQAGLGDVGGQHHFAQALGRRVDGRTLGVEIELAMQRAKQDLGALAQRFLQALVHPADLGLTWQEYQHTASLVSQCLQHAIHYPWLDELTRLERPPPTDVDGVHAAFAADHRGIIQQPRKALALQGRGHQQNLQWRVVPQQLPAIQAQCQGQVGIKAALVKFVEDHQPHPLQRRVGLQAAGEDAFGHYLDAGFRPDLAVQADAIAHGFADLFAQLAGQALGRSPRCQAPGFEHENALPSQPRLIEQRQRHAGGLAGARWRLEHRFVTVFQGLAQGGQDSIDR
ncbi:hypothetical protein D3C76_455050 [compost metagenome]